MQRRRFLLGSLTAFAGASLPRLAWANVPTAYSWELSPPLDDRDAYIEWMVTNRGEDPKLLQQHWSRYEAVVQANEGGEGLMKRACLLLPRVEFLLPRILGRAYEHAYLDIGYG